MKSLQRMKLMEPSWLPGNSFLSSLYMKEHIQKAIKKIKKPVVQVDERLNRFIGVDLFPEKTARANKYGAAVRIPKNSK